MPGAQGTLASSAEVAILEPAPETPAGLSPHIPGLWKGVSSDWVLAKVRPDTVTVIPVAGAGQGGWGGSGWQ